MQKVNFRRVVAVALFIFLMIFFSGMFISCGSSKKHKEKESYENTVKTEIDSSSSSSVKTDDKVKEDLIVIEHDLYNLYCDDFLIRSLFPEYKQAYMMFIINLN